MRANQEFKIEDPSYRVKHDDEIIVTLPPLKDVAIKAENMPLDILYEDDALVVINKPAGMVVHPAPGHHSGTLVNALMAHCGTSLSGIGGERRPGIVHRLDKDTSGVMVACKHDKAHHYLAEQFASHGKDGRLQRRYQCFVWSSPVPAAGRIDAALARHTSIAPKFRFRKARKHGLRPPNIKWCKNGARLPLSRYWNASLRRVARIKSECIWRI